MVAGLLDLGLSVILGGILLAIGAALRLPERLALGDLTGQLVAAVAISLTVSLALAVFESGPLEATPGKLARGLRVRRAPGGDRLSFPRAVLRNLFKLGLPVPLAYLAGVAAWAGGGPAAWVGLGAAVVVGVSYLAGALFGEGRAVYDQVSGSMVIRALPGRRFA